MGAHIPTVLSTLAGTHLAFKTASLRHSVQAIKPEAGLATKYIKCSNVFVHKGHLCHPSIKKGRILPYHHQIFRKLCKPLLNSIITSVTHFRIISLLDWISYYILFYLFSFSVTPCSMGDLKFEPRFEPKSPALEVQNVNHWTSREVSLTILLITGHFKNKKSH